MVRKQKRRVLLALGGVAGLFVLVLATFPFWFPWMLQKAAPSYGLNYSDYERIGYSRFALSNAIFTNQTTTVTAGRLEGYMPLAWLWGLYVSKGEGAYARLDHWKVAVRSSGAPSAKRAEPSVHQIYRNTEKILTNISRWLPKAVLHDGTIEAGEQIVQVPQAVWGRERLSGHVVLPKIGQKAVVMVEVPAGDTRHLEIQSESLHLHSRMLVTKLAEGLSIQSTNTWLSNRVVASAAFGLEGTVPQTAKVEANQFSVPAGLLYLEPYEHVKGDLQLQWLTNQFTVNVTAQANPTNAAELPPVNLKLAGSGNTESVTLQKAEVNTPWLEASLREGTLIQYSSPFLQEQTVIPFTLDLDQQRWVEGSGKLTGQIELRPGQGALPDSTFAVNGTDLTLVDIQGLMRRQNGSAIDQGKKRSLRTKSLVLEGEVVWPELRLNQARVETADGSTFSLNGIADLSSRMVHYGQFAYAGVYAREWLPPGTTYSNATLSGSLNGPWTNLNHSGQVHIKGLKVPLLPIMDAAGTWKGEQLRLDPIQLSLDTGKSTLAINGAIDLGKEAKLLRVAGLSLGKGGIQQLVSQKPFEILWASGKGITNAGRIEVTPWEWSGPGGSIQLSGEISWPAQGHLAGKIERLRLETFSDFLPFATNRTTIHQLQIAGGWTNGPIQFQTELAASGQQGNGLDVGVQGKIIGGSEGLQVESLTLSNRNQQLATAKGKVPVVFRPDGTNGFLDINLEAPLSFGADLEPSALSEYLKAAGLGFRNPELHIQMEGTLASPKGQVQFAASQLQMTRTNQNLPALEDVRLKAFLEPGIARLETFKFSIEKQPVVVRAEMPMERKIWSNLAKGIEGLDWKQLSAELGVEHMKLAALRPYLPRVISPEGEIDGKIRVEPGGKVGGTLTVSGARTYPIASIGAVRDILVRLRFEDRRVFLEAAAEAGGQPIPITGTADLRGEEWLSRKVPPFQVKIGGAQVPLSRTPELILKADLALAVVYDGKEPVTVTGNVNLRDGFYLRDLADLTSGKVSTPSRRPPYFSVEQLPLADWRLQLNVTGDKFLKVRSPLFNGVVSTGLRLQGTLREPLATGELKINSGEVRFPFATMPITQGLILLTSENPFRPQLAVMAAARTFGYDIKMELTGFADAPVVQFTSTPSLSSEQILLMVSAGDLPHGEMTVTGQQKAQRLALFVGKDLLSGLGFSGDASRLTIRSGEDVSEAGKSTYSIEYKLQEDWSIIGEYDRFNDFNLMLKWRVYSK